MFEYSANDSVHVDVVVVVVVVVVVFLVDVVIFVIVFLVDVVVVVVVVVVDVVVDTVMSLRRWLCDFKKGQTYLRKNGHIKRLPLSLIQSKSLENNLF